MISFTRTRLWSCMCRPIPYPSPNIKSLFLSKQEFIIKLRCFLHQTYFSDYFGPVYGCNSNSAKDLNYLDRLKFWYSEKICKVVARRKTIKICFVLCTVCDFSLSHFSTESNRAYNEKDRRPPVLLLQMFVKSSILSIAYHLPPYNLSKVSLMLRGDRFALMTGIRLQATELKRTNY